MPKIASWLYQVINKLEVKEFYFLSHSWGSFVSLFFIKDYPDKVKGTILIDGGYQGKRHGEQSVDEEVAYYENDFEDYVETWEQFLELVNSETLNWTPLKEIAAKDLSLQVKDRYYWHARGETAGHIIRAMHKDEPEDIYPFLPKKIILLGATLPHSRDTSRRKLASLFEEKAQGIIKFIPETTHLLHWDKPEVVIKEIRHRWK
ncbi:alpha/beta fold hydrolase [Rossellomorea aquimaris]|uniref:alpha/beta fold hydrolase n=1 Tax=Rossellomorea aquimaris TaxID=189382 RepID=UPI0007D0B94B|nr:alpha/beta hydrolase [Rossellomorea aquimaris]